MPTQPFVTYALLRAGLSLREIADVLGVSRETISTRKTGRKGPGVDVQEAKSVTEGLLAQGLSGDKLIVALIRKAWKWFPAGSRTFPNGDPDWRIPDEFGPLAPLRVDGVCLPQVF
ncbi:MAG: helix-turn-helix domain-containing protein, partial [Thermoplasmata archaeon]